MRPLLATVAVLSSVACSASSNTGKGSEPSAALRSFSVFLTTELRGTIGPCGCTSDPLGDLARTAQILTDARAAGPVLYLDGGSALYTGAKIEPQLAAQEALKSDLISAALTGPLAAAAIGLGPNDLAAGASKVRPPRSAANVPAAAGVALAPPQVLEVGGVKVGVFGVVAPEAVAAAGIKATPAAEAANTAIAHLRTQGAEVIIALAHMTRTDAAALARAAVGIDFMLIGQNAPEPTLVRAAPTKVRGTWLVRPANRGQVVTRIDISVRGKRPFVDAIGPARAKHELTALEKRAAGLRDEIKTFEADSSADPAFVARKKSELAALETQRKALARSPLRVPKSGSWFVMQQLRIDKRLACDPSIVSKKQAYDKAAGEANVKAAKNTKPAAPAKGKAAYSGVGECAMCHKKAVKFWEKTRHFGAWGTLEKVGKQFDYDCIGCHVTGWDKPGGSNLGYNKELRSVQCEVCHGPGSIHSDEDGEESPSTMVRKPAEDLCKRCHSQEHSDTFQFEAYLRDVTGPGHGAKLRKKLGDGPTGKQLRAAAQKKAGKSIGKGCPK